MGRHRAMPPRPEVYYSDLSRTRYVIEAIEPSILGRYRVYLRVGDVMNHAGNDGWGWGTWSLAGAKRKGARELARYRRRQARLARRRRLTDHNEQERR